MERVDGIFESIKSVYILREILSLLNDSNKFEILKYNKKFQKKSEISINDFKKQSGRYVVVKNGIAKEYILDKNLLIFEGQY